MTTRISVKISLLLSFSSVILLLGVTGCGGKSSTPATVTTCVAGQIDSQYGCLQACGDGVNWGVYNNTCTYIGAAATAASCQSGCPSGQVQTQLGCLPQTPPCHICQGNINGTCIPATGGLPGTGGNPYYPPGYNGGFFQVPPNYPSYWYHGNQYM
jgi:hypothetical protein